MKDRTFIYFLLAGGIAALVNLAARYAINKFTYFEIAVVVAYLIGMLTAYVLCRAFVFGPSGRTRSSEIRRFVVVNIGALAVVWLVSVGLARLIFPAVGFTWHADDIAHFVGVFAPAVISFFGHKHYSFRRESV